MKKYIYLLIIPIFLTSCSSDNDRIPVPVLENIKEEEFGKPEKVKENLKITLDIIKKRYAEVGNINKITIDYLNVNNGEISYNENWPTSIGIGFFNIISVFLEENRITLSGVDTNSVCWYIEVSEKKKKLDTKYGSSDDNSCKASSREDYEINWDKIEFPLSTVNSPSLNS